MAGSYIILSEADQKKFGCPDRLRYEIADITAREQATLQKAFGYHAPEDIAEALRLMLTPGEGKPIRRDANLYLALTWLALRQNDHLNGRGSGEMAAELADLDIQLAWTLLDFNAEPEGKDEGSTPTRTSTT